MYAEIFIRGLFRSFDERIARPSEWCTGGRARIEVGNTFEVEDGAAADTTHFLALVLGGGAKVYSPSTWSWLPSALPVLL